MSKSKKTNLEEVANLYFEIKRDIQDHKDRKLDEEQFKERMKKHTQKIKEHRKAFKGKKLKWSDPWENLNKKGGITHENL